MVKNVTQIKIGTTTNVGVSVKIQKNIMDAKKIIFGIPLHTVAKKYYKHYKYLVLLTIQWLRVMNL